MRNRFHLRIAPWLFGTFGLTGVACGGGADDSSLGSTGGASFASGGAASGGTTGSGGAASGGTASGGASTGGQETGTPATPYDHGVVPSTVTVEQARAAYDAWKEVHLEDCGSGKYRVRWENQKLDATVSEGIGYGMLLAVSWGEREVLDGLYEYYQSALNGWTGLMNWLRYGCDAHYDTKYSQYPDGAAADADLDVAMALIMAHCRFGDEGYAAEASSVIAAIREHMFMDDGDLHVLQPGDSDWFDGMGNGCVNYSYFSPAYYRAFAAYDTANATFWNDAADDTYELLARASNSTTGLVRNWGSSDGGDATSECHDAYHRASSYGDDAARTPWRVVTDYLWYGTPAAETFSDRVTSWVASEGIENTVQWYLLDGNPDTSANTYSDHTVINVGPWATAAMSSDAATVDAFAAEVLAIPTTAGSHDAEYFPRMLKALSLVTLVGKFTACGGAETE